MTTEIKPESEPTMAQRASRLCGLAFYTPTAGRRLDMEHHILARCDLRQIAYEHGLLRDALEAAVSHFDHGRDAVYFTAQDADVLDQMRDALLGCIKI